MSVTCPHAWSNRPIASYWWSGRTQRVVPARAPDSVWVGRRRGGREAIIGGLAGAALGAGTGALLSGICSDGGDSNPCYSYIPLDGLVGGAVGGLFGFLVGSKVTSYHREVPN